MYSANKRILGKALAIWPVLILVKILHGILQGVVLAPRVGEFRSNQIGVFTGSAIMLALTWAFLR